MHSRAVGHNSPSFLPAHGKIRIDSKNIRNPRIYLRVDIWIRPKLLVYIPKTLIHPCKKPEVGKYLPTNFINMKLYVGRVPN